MVKRWNYVDRQYAGQGFEVDPAGKWVAIEDYDAIHAAWTAAAARAMDNGAAANALRAEIERLERELAEARADKDAWMHEFHATIAEQQAQLAEARGLLLELDEAGAVSNWLRVTDDLRARVRAFLARREGAL